MVTAVAACTAYQLKITLLETLPPIWRRFVVPVDITLDRLDRVIQSVMGWEDRHLHQFTIQGLRFMNPRRNLIMLNPFCKIRDERRTKLNTLVSEVGVSFLYEYDFTGGPWRHKVELEKIFGRRINGLKLLAGERDCPPEDCGGPAGYEELLQAVRNGQQPKRKAMIKWLEGYALMSEVFDKDYVRQDLLELEELWFGESR